MLEAKDLTGNARSEPPKEFPGLPNDLEVQGAVRDDIRKVSVANPVVLMDEFAPFGAVMPSLRQGWTLFLNPEVPPSSNGLYNLAHIVLFAVGNADRKEFEPSTLNRFIVLLLKKGFARATICSR